MINHIILKCKEWFLHFLWGSPTREWNASTNATATTSTTSRSTTQFDTPNYYYSAIVEDLAVQPQVVEEVPGTVRDRSGSKRISLVISQLGCSRAQVINTLKQNDGDFVNAIVSVLSTN
jgi:NACalpha-BTF3-like transcription factor